MFSLYLIDEKLKSKRLIARDKIASRILMAAAKIVSEGKAIELQRDHVRCVLLESESGDLHARDYLELETVPDIGEEIEITVRSFPSFGKPPAAIKVSRIG